MHQTYTVVIIVLLVLFSVYRRVRRNIGFQKFHPKQMWTRTILFVVLGLLILVAGYGHPIVYVSDAVGLVLGIALAVAAMYTTKFEQRGADWYYRASGWISGIVLAIFFIRLLYRFVMVYDMAKLHGANRAHFQTSTYVTDPWTAGAIFVLFAYYACYYGMLLRRGKSLEVKQVDA